MRTELKLFRSQARACTLLAGLVGAALAGCSSEATRYSDDPFSNPFSSRMASNEVTHSATPRPSATVESQPLPNPQPSYSPPPSHASAPPPNYSAAPRTVPATPAPHYNSQHVNSAPYSTGTVPAPRPGEAGWRWDGGTAVTLQAGETIDTIAQRYGVPPTAILRANNLSDASRLQPGQRLVIPSFQQGPAGTPQLTPASAPVRARAMLTHVVNHGETLASISKRYGVSQQDITRLNKLAANTQVRVGQRLTVPAPQPASQSAARGGPAGPAPGRRVEAPAASNSQTAGGPAASETVAAVKPVEQPLQTPAHAGTPQFRWPVKGRVISGFGAKPNGQHNDGINLAVPEGAEVKAAEGGVVAYVGNELKGYGNLVLIRHAEGWVTAYAHNSEMLVRRGDTVKRGQTIARAGQTGGVPQPQLHFEIRKGSTPVDPAQHLSSL